MLSETTAFIIGGSLCALGMCCFFFPKKFVKQRNGIPPPAWLDWSWVSYTEPRVKAMGILYFVLGALVLIRKIFEVVGLG